MLKKIIITLLILLCLGIIGIFSVKKFMNFMKHNFQLDADIIRVEHLVYWTGLLEEYNKKTGTYPFKSAISSKDKIGLVRIATKEQQQYFNQNSPSYNKNYDNNSSGVFDEFSVKEFIAELEKGLGRKIDEKYDIQRVPSGSPVWYNYFIAEKGYLFWVTCITCKISPISTLLMDGSTPTINIVSERMKGEIPKCLPRDVILSHPLFKELRKRKFKKEGFSREREKKKFKDSKSY